MEIQEAWLFYIIIKKLLFYHLKLYIEQDFLRVLPTDPRVKRQPVNTTHRNL